MSKFFALIALSLTLVMCSHKPDVVEEKASAPATTTSSSDIIGGVSYKKTKCTKEKDERILDERAGNGGCELVYVKFGTEKSIATSKTGKTYCGEVMEKIKKNLTQSGYKCE